MVWCQAKYPVTLIVSVANDEIFFCLGPDIFCTIYLEGDGRLVRGEEGVPDELALELLPVLAVHKLEH